MKRHVYKQCPGCNDGEGGDKVVRCNACGTMYCDSCKDKTRSWYTSYCPHCGADICDSEQYGTVEAWYDKACPPDCDEEH